MLGEKECIEPDFKFEPLAAEEEENSFEGGRGIGFEKKSKTRGPARGVRKKGLESESIRWEESQRIRGSGTVKGGGS